MQPADITSMKSVKLRSRRDPAFWLPIALCVAVLVPLIVGAHFWMTNWLKDLQVLAASDPEAARDEAIRFLRISTWSLCAVMLCFCAYFIRYCQLGRREGRLPPSGWWSLGAFRVIVGRRARRLSEFGFMISAVLIAASIGLGFAVEYLIRLIEGGMLVT
jgi:hypothetical protein